MTAKTHDYRDDFRGYADRDTPELEDRIGQLQRVEYYQLDRHGRHEHGAICRELRRRELRENEVLLAQLVQEEFQTLGSDLLQMAIEKGLNFDRIAKNEMANRGLDENGEWIGFARAKKIWGSK